ncbi:MAG: hypothetical protein ACK526_18915 [Planctomyces sp.]|jgi:hypothetical protein
MAIVITLTDKDHRALSTVLSHLKVRSTRHHPSFPSSDSLSVFDIEFFIFALIQASGLFLGISVVMQCQHFDVVPGERLRIGALIVTVVSVEKNGVSLRFEDPDHPDDGFVCDPVTSYLYRTSQTALV